jgi:hypothetical protein
MDNNSHDSVLESIETPDQLATIAVVHATA